MPFRDSGLKIDFSFERQNGLIGARGTYVIHEISTACPCQQSEGSDGAVGHPDPTCSTCLGSGFIYRDPVRMQALLTNLSNDRMWAQVGWVEPGDLSMSPELKARRLSDFDRITITMPKPTDSQVIVRGKASPMAPRGQDLLSNEDQLYWEAGRNTAIWLEDENGVVYEAGVYLLQGRKVVWAPSSGPAVGVKYSIKYEAYPEYICWATPMDRWDRQRELGQRVMIRAAVIDSNPSRRVVRPPWEDRILGHPDGTDDPYSVYGEGLSVMSRKVDPAR